MGGGTDIPEFCRDERSIVVSSAIDKYITVVVKHNFEKKNRICYSVVENTDLVDDIHHDLIRECMKYFNIEGLEIVTFADVPGTGTGLGSSSALCVGLVHALLTLTRKQEFNPIIYANLAYHIERDMAGHPVGRQDHFASACGGIKEYHFLGNHYQEINQLIEKERCYLLEEHMLLLFTGTTRNANKILEDQAQMVPNTRDILRQMRDDAGFGIGLIQDGWMNMLGQYLTKNWTLKKQLSSQITNPDIDLWLEQGMNAGAYGGKLCGAGGGGFILFIAPPEKHNDICKATGLKKTTVKISHEGTKTIYAD